MIGIKVIVFLIYSFFIQFSKSIDLILPLSESDAPNFKIKKIFETEPRPHNDYVYHMTKYEGLQNDLIRRVVYHGLELINDTHDHTEDFKRYVLYGHMRNRVVIAIANIQSGEVTYDPALILTEDGIINYILSPEIEETIITGIPTSNMGVLLSTIFDRSEDSNKRKYDDLDSVDDKPYLLRGNTDISSKKIKKEVEAIMQNINSTPDDPSVPGPSGLSQHSDLKLKEKQ